MFKKLRNRFLLLHMVVVSLLIALFFGSILFIGYRTLEQDTDNRADTLWARRYSFPQQVTARRSALLPDNTQQTPENGIFTPATGSGAFTPPANGGFFARPVAAERVSLRMQVMPAIYVLTDNAQEIIAVDSAYDMDDVFYADITKAAFARTATAGKVNVGSFTLKYRRAGPEMLFIDVTSESDFLTGMAYALLFIAVPLLVLIFLLSLFFAHRSIKPIEINYNRQKEFIADASHELKTPLAVISANLEAYNGGQDARFLGYIQEEVGRMAGLTNSLLYLAKMDNPVSSVMLPVDLSRMAEDIWLPLEAVLYEKGITADIDLAQGITVLGDEEQLRRLIGILTDNAVRYADKKITASLERIQNQAVFIIANDGSGIPPEDIEKIWERFYRCDASHQSPQETVPFDGGYGLGLPMAKAITERHKGKIQCQSIPGEMTAFTVRLPVRD